MNTFLYTCFFYCYRCSAEKDEEVQDREDFRKDRAKERQRERNLAKAAPEKRFEISVLLVLNINFKDCF